MMSAPPVKITATCPNCGEKFTQLNGGKIPTHDFPKPCRSVCRGSGEDPKHRADTPLWKDDPEQQARDYFDSARTALLLYGFAVVKQMAEFSGQNAGFTQCPLCGQPVKYVIAPSNRHCRARCETDKCINAGE